MPSTPFHNLFHFHRWKGKYDEIHIKTVGETLRALFRKSGVADAHSHRFRHTLATEILAKGGTIEAVANILGDAPPTVKHHYSKWSLAWRKTLVETLALVNGPAPGTFVAHTENVGGSSSTALDWLVPGVDLNPHFPFGKADFKSVASAYNRSQTHEIFPFLLKSV